MRSHSFRTKRTAPISVRMCASISATMRQGHSGHAPFQIQRRSPRPGGRPAAQQKACFVGDNQGYLMYAARWFPFHDYAADPATSDITISLPGGFQVVGFSDTPVSNVGGKSRFVQSKPALVGNFAYGKYRSKNDAHRRLRAAILRKAGKRQPDRLVTARRSARRSITIQNAWRAPTAASI